MKTKVQSRTIIKNNRTPEILAALKRARGSYVTVGVHNKSGQYGKGGDKAATPVKVAHWLEYGTENMPARPFMYPAMARNKKAIATIVARSLVSIAYLKRTVAQGLTSIGQPVVIMIQNVIKSNVGPALSGTWNGGKDDKGTGYLRWRRAHYPESGQRTLIASGLLLRSVRFALHLTGAAAAEVATAKPLFIDAEEKGAKKVKGPPQAGRDEFGRFLKKTPAQIAAAREAARKNAATFKATQKAQREQAKAHPNEQAAAFNRQKRAYVRGAKPQA